jgi:hypothetical protein
MLPSGVSAVPASPAHLDVPARQSDAAQRQDAMSAAQQIITFDRARFSLGIRQYAYEHAAKSAAAEAARAAAGKAAVARAQTRAHVQRQTTVVSSGSSRQIAAAMLGQFGWSGSQFSCLDPLWGHESRWSVKASNAGTGAYGIPQALPGSKMGSVGPDWQTSAATQIRWGLKYIQGTYGSPCAAWSHEEADGWY